VNDRQYKQYSQWTMTLQRWLITKLLQDCNFIRNFFVCALWHRHYLSDWYTCICCLIPSVSHFTFQAYRFC